MTKPTAKKTAGHTHEWVRATEFVYQGEKGAEYDWRCTGCPSRVRSAKEPA